MQVKYPFAFTNDNWLINASIFPDISLAAAIQQLQIGQCLIADDKLIAARLDEVQIAAFLPNSFAHLRPVDYKQKVAGITYPWDLFSQNDEQLRSDFKLITKGRTSAPISATNQVIEPADIFIEHGATVECATLNAKPGPIYIGVNAEIMEGSLVRGPFALCEHSTLKLGAKIYGATTIGPHCKVGGEVHNSIFTGYSNKAHDGFLGNAVLGEWCNLGADTNNSNLKNNYSEVKMWNYEKEGFIRSGLLFCGLIMGDHSKCGINTMFNTGTVVGVSANIFGSGYQRNFIPSFTWGGPQGIKEYPLNQALATTRIVFDRRGLKVSEADEAILNEVFDQTAKFRTFFELSELFYLTKKYKNR